MPLPAELSREYRTRVLVISLPFKSLLASRNLNAQSDNGLTLDRADNLLEVGLRLGRHQYQCLVLELADSAALTDAVELIRLIRDHLLGKRLPIIAFAPHSGERQASHLRLAGCDEIIISETDMRLVRETMQKNGD